MQPIQHILIPVDFHEPSNRAIELAVQMAAQLNAKLTLMHAIEVLVYAYPEAPMVPMVDPMPELAQSAQNGLETMAESLRTRWANIDTILRYGTPWSEILEAAKETQSDMIVMGTHGRHGLSRIFLGSVAEKIVRHSEIPVLTVRSS